MTETTSSTPVAQPQSYWRTALQVPLLLVAAAGLGFAGQQMWQNRNDVQSLLGYNSEKATACAMSEVNDCATQNVGCGGSASESCSPGADADCCAAMLAAFEAANAPVSALKPENVSEAL